MKIDRTRGFEMAVDCGRCGCVGNRNVLHPLAKGKWRQQLRRLGAVHVAAEKEVNKRRDR